MEAGDDVVFQEGEDEFFGGLFVVVWDAFEGVVGGDEEGAVGFGVLEEGLDVGVFGD